MLRIVKKNRKMITQKVNKIILLNKKPLIIIKMITNNIIQKLICVVGILKMMIILEAVN